MNSKIIKRLNLALAVSLISVLFFPAYSYAQEAALTSVERPSLFIRPPLFIKGAKVSTEAQAKELAWKNFINLMDNIHQGISATVGIRVVDTITLGFDVPGYAKNGDHIWELRAIDMRTGLKAIIWVHAESQQVKFLISPAAKEGIPTIPTAVSDAAFPDVNIIKNITLNKGTAGETLTAEEFQQLIKTAEPMSQEEFMKHAIPGGYWYRGSFTTPAGIYRFTLGLGGVNYLTLPGGASMHFKFNRKEWNGG